jgi:hypothetical protein
MTNFNYIAVNPNKMYILSVYFCTTLVLSMMLLKGKSHKIKVAFFGLNGIDKKTLLIFQRNGLN